MTRESVGCYTIKCETKQGGNLLAEDLNNGCAVTFDYNLENGLHNLKTTCDGK